jgi:glyoxylate/hydroxypyruvate reductase A
VSQAIAYISRDTDGLHWKKVLEEALGAIDYRTLDSLGNTDDIEIALAWKPDRGLLASFKNIRLIVSLGMASTICWPTTSCPMCRSCASWTTAWSGR